MNIGVKLEHFKKLQEKLEFHQNKCHHGNASNTRRQCVKATDQWTQVVAGRPGRLIGPTLQPLAGLLHRHALQGTITRNLKLEIGGSRTRWLDSLVARPASQHLACYQLNQVSNSSLDPYKYPLLMEFKISHSTCSSTLIKVSV
jgi:hypothetical protein